MNETLQVATRGSVAAADNSDGLDVVLTTEGRKCVNLHYTVSGDAQIDLEYRTRNDDGVTGDWHSISSFDTSQSGTPSEDTVQEPFVAAYEVRATTDTTGIDVSFDVSASK